MSEAADAKAPTGRKQRKFKNYLLDPKFQLKYTAYLVLIAVALSTALGAMLWSVSAAVLDQASQGVQLSQQVVKRGREVVTESKKVSAVVQMNIIKDPDYKDNPGLMEAFKEDSKKQNQRFAEQQADLEKQAAALEQQNAKLASERQTMTYALVIGLLALVLVIGVAGIYVTHKISGPIFKMKRHLNEVAEGQLQVPRALRKGDELVEFFDTFANMVKQLRTRQEAEIVRLDAAIAELEGKADDASMKPLHELRQEMQDALG